MSARKQGERWERTAESFLAQRGLRTLERNFHCRFGEIDIIMNDGDFLVFVEVKYRRRDLHGAGAEHVDARKQRRIESTAAYYLARNPRQASRPCHFDVVDIISDAGVDGAKNGIKWIRDAFHATRG